LELINLWNFLHVGSAIVWAGGTFSMAWFIGPAAAKAGPAAGPFMGALASGRMRMVMMVTSVITVLSGVLMWTDAVEGSPKDFGTWMLTIGALAGLVATGIGHGVQQRTARKLGRVQVELAGNPPTAEQGQRLGALQSKLMKTGAQLAWVMVIAIIGMTIGAR
jgi:uncharacterized membrane protein